MIEILPVLTISTFRHVAHFREQITRHSEGREAASSTTRVSESRRRGRRADAVEGELRGTISTATAVHHESRHQSAKSSETDPDVQKTAPVCASLTKYGALAYAQIYASNARRLTDTHAKPEQL